MFNQIDCGMSYPALVKDAIEAGLFPGLTEFRKSLSWEEAFKSSQKLSWQAAEIIRGGEEELLRWADSFFELAQEKAESLGEREAFEAKAAEWESAKLAGGAARKGV